MRLLIYKLIIKFELIYNYLSVDAKNKLNEVFNSINELPQFEKLNEALEELNDATGIEVNLEGKYAIVETNESDDLIKEKVEDMGYDVIKIENI